MRELVCSLWDALCNGDLAGHLRSWWRTVSGQIDLDDTVEFGKGR